jgi:hypothetical protein
VLFQQSEAVISERTAALKLSDIAMALQSDWVPLAERLGVTESEVIKIQAEFGSIVEQVCDQQLNYTTLFLFS